MKKSLIFCLALVFSLVSCEEDLVIFETPEGFVQLDSSSATIDENSDDNVVTTVLLGKGDNPNGVTVNFSVTSSDMDRFSVTPSTGSITIPAGEFSADIIIDILDNDVIDGDFDIVIQLLESSDVPIGIGGEGNFSTTKTISVIDNEVICNDLTLVINSDFYATETRWDVKDSEGNILESGGPYENGRTTYTINFSLEDGCYTFTFYDDYGDGQNDGGLIGDYKLTCSTLVHAQGSGALEEDFFETTEFCVNQ